MRLSDLCIRRPVFTTMLIASLLVLGLAFSRDLGLDAFPRIEFPTMTVSTTHGVQWSAMIVDSAPNCRDNYTS